MNTVDFGENGLRVYCVTKFSCMCLGNAPKQVLVIKGSQSKVFAKFFGFIICGKYQNARSVKTTCMGIANKVGQEFGLSMIGDHDNNCIVALCGNLLGNGLEPVKIGFVSPEIGLEISFPIFLGELQIRDSGMKGSSIHGSPDEFQRSGVVNFVIIPGTFSRNIPHEFVYVIGIVLSHDGDALIVSARFGEDETEMIAIKSGIMDCQVVDVVDRGIGGQGTGSMQDQDSVIEGI
jgi:hypothetical protein